MPVPDISGLPPFADFNDVTVKINDLVQRLRQLLLTLDTLNIRSLHAKVIEANTITADKMNVNELSAIAADLGHITAGLIESVEIYGSYIATRKDAFPRAELDSNSNLFGAYAAANNYIQIYTPTSGFSPTIKFGTPSGIAYMTYNITDNSIAVSSNDANINISTLKTIELFANTVLLYGWSYLKNTSGRNLQQELDSKSSKGTQTGSAGSANGGIPIGTVFKDVNGVSYTWQGIPAHSHTQN